MREKTIMVGKIKVVIVRPTLTDAERDKQTKQIVEAIKIFGRRKAT